MVSRYFLSAVALFTVLVTLATHAIAQPSGATAIETFRGLTFAQYGEYSLQLDLYRPVSAVEPLPVVLVVREGGWAHGEKETTGGLAAALARRGIAAASIEYRGASEASFPAYVHDVKAAVRWVRANAALYNLDPDAIGAMGGSWGGYLSVYAGMTDGISDLEGGGGSQDSSSRLDAIVGISAPLHMAGFPDSMERMLGESLANNPDLWEFASATSHVNEDSPPLLLIASQTDTTVPYEQTLMMAEAYGEAAVEIEVHFLPEVGHAPFWHFNTWLHDRAAEFFHRHLKSD